MIPLEEVQELLDLAREEDASDEQPRQIRAEAQPRFDTRSLIEQAQGLSEPTLKFAGIGHITDEEMAETKAAFQNTIWTTIQRNPEWIEIIRDKGIQNKEDIVVEEAVVKAEVRDNKVMRKYGEQLVETKTSHIFRQVATMCTLVELYMDQGCHNEALSEYVNQEVTSINAITMRVAAIMKARKEAKAEMLVVAGLETQAEQDEWWKNHIVRKFAHGEGATPIDVIKLNQLIATWKRQLIVEIESLSVIQQVRMLKKIIQYIM